MTNATLPTQSSAPKIAWLDRPLWKRLTPAILILVAIMLLSAVLHFYNINSIGDANVYYTAVVKSMLISWKNFFFVAAEPGGSVTVDKPPLGLWIEAAFAYFFGVSGFSVSLPNILAGVLGIPLLYGMVKRNMGELAGLVAAFVMAITPVFVATNRNNTMDGLLVFFLLMAAWAFIQATETGKCRWLLLGAFIVGLGFNIKMLQALLPLPAFYALYFFGSKESWLRKTFNLTLATVLLIAVSLSWAIAVDLTPADQRPYIGSSKNNNVMGLIFGHNGISRLGTNDGLGGGASSPNGQMPIFTPQAGTTGQQGSQPQQGNRPSPPQRAVDACASSVQGASCSFTELNGNTIDGFCITPPDIDALVCAPQGMIPQNGQNTANGQVSDGDLSGQDLNGQGGAGVGGTHLSQETGDSGVLRFFTAPLSRQISWLLPFALISVLLALLGSRIKLPIETGAHKALLIWGGWLLTCVVFFSMISGIFHAYYAIMLAPSLSAMVGIGFAQLWSWGTDKKWTGIVLVISAALTIGFQYFSAAQYGETSWWLPAGAILLGLGILLMVAQKHLAYITILAAIMVIPMYWTVMTVITSPNNNLPTAYTGSNQQQASVDRPNQQTDSNEYIELRNYLEENTQDVEYLVAVPSSGQQGAQLVLATGRPVLYIGGFNGGDDVVSAEDLSAMVANGELRYILFGGDRGNKEEISNWLQYSCSVVPEFSVAASSNRPSVLQAPDGQQGLDNQAMTLYLCK